MTAAELSPRALYVAAGIGRTLVAMAPDGRRAWAYPAGGTVAAIAWAPSGLEIAYVVRRGGGFELRRIEGDGDHDRVVDRAVRPVRPSWRADSLALAYVGAGGRAVVRDYARGSRSVVAAPAPATAVAFAQYGGRLAVASRGRVRVWDGGRSTRAAATAGRVAGLAWTSSGLAVAVEPAAGPSFVRSPVGRVPVEAERILALAAAGSRTLVAAVAGGAPLRVLASDSRGRAPPRLDRSLLVLRGGRRVDVLVAR